MFNKISLAAVQDAMYMYNGARPSVVIIVSILWVIKTANGYSISCVQCSWPTDKSCLDQPPDPVDCTICYRYHSDGTCAGYYNDFNYCVTSRKYNGTGLHSLTRACTSIFMKDDCDRHPDKDNPGHFLEICESVCDTDGCNAVPYDTLLESGSWSLHSSSSFRLATFSLLSLSFIGLLGMLE